MVNKKRRCVRSPCPPNRESAARRVGFATIRTAREVEEDVASSDPDSEADRARSAPSGGERAKRAETGKTHPLPCAGRGPKHRVCCLTGKDTYPTIQPLKPRVKKSKTTPSGEARTGTTCYSKEIFSL